MAQVSIIIPTIRPDFVKEAVESAENQTIPCEVIVEDGKDGACIALNRGVRRSHGEYIFNLDDDDLLPEYAIERLLSEIKDNDVIFSDLLLYPSMIPFKQGFYGYDELLKNNTMPGVLMTTRKAWEKVPFVEEFNTGYDYERNLRFCGSGLKIKHLPEYLYYYRQHEGQTQKLLGEEQTKNNLLSKKIRLDKLKY